MDRCPSGGTLVCSWFPHPRAWVRKAWRPLIPLCRVVVCMQKESWCSSAVSYVAVRPTDHGWTVPGEMQALGKAALQCAERLHHPERASSLEPLLLCSSYVTWPLSTVLSRQLSSLLCPYIYLPSVVGHVTEGFNLFTALLLVIYLLYSLLSCII